MPSSQRSPASTCSMPGAAATPVPAAIACRRLAQIGDRHLAVDQQHAPRPRRPPIQEGAAGGDRMRDAERDMGLAGAAHGVEQHQALLGNDRVEHHPALRDVEREQLGEIERGEVRGASASWAQASAATAAVRRRGERRRIGNEWGAAAPAPGRRRGITFSSWVMWFPFCLMDGVRCELTRRRHRCGRRWNRLRRIGDESPSGVQVAGLRP